MEKNNIIVSLKGVNKAFGDEKVVKNLNLEIREGEFLTLLGISAIIHQKNKRCLHQR